MTMCRFAKVEKVLFPALFGLRVDHIDDLSMNLKFILDSLNNFIGES